MRPPAPTRRISDKTRRHEAPPEGRPQGRELGPYPRGAPASSVWTQARRQLYGLVNGMERSGLRCLVSSRGKPKAVLIGVSDCLMTVLRRKRASIVAEMQLEAKAKGLDKLPAAGMPDAHTLPLALLPATSQLPSAL